MASGREDTTSSCQFPYATQPTSSLDRDGELDHEAVGDRSGHGPQLVGRLVVREHHVRREAYLAEGRDARLVARGGVHGLARVRGQGDLRGRDPVRLRRRLVEARVDLEVDVRPAPLVARREDARELDDPVVPGRLNAAEVVLTLDTLAVERVPAG